MKRCTRKSLMLVPLIVILLLEISLVNPKAFAYNAQRDKYLLNVFLDDINFILKGQLILEHHNRHNKVFDELYFHVYPNAFKSYGGYITIESVQNFDSLKQLKFVVEGEDSTILKVYLDSPLNPGSTIKLKLNFTVKIPFRGDRFGYRNGIFALGYFYPILAMYDETGWNLNPYTWIGDPVYAEISDYDVYIVTREYMVIAATGVQVEVEQLGEELKREHWVAPKVREFAFVASKYFTVLKTTWENITIYSYFKEDKGSMGDAALKFGEKAIKAFSEHVGRYPYPEFRIVEVDFGYGGMEYPMLVMIASNLYTPSTAFYLELVVAHETGHQWFYSLVGNDEYDEPWLDEGFTEMLTILYFEWNYDWKRGLEVLNMYKSRYYSYLSRYSDYPIALPVGFFEKSSYPHAYYYIVYRKGSCVLFMLRRMLGDETFFNIIRTYFRRFEFKIAKIKDFKQVAEEVSGEDLDWFFEQWVYGNGIPSYNIVASKTYPSVGGYVLEMDVEQLNSLLFNAKLKIPFLIKTSSGDYLKWLWVNGSLSKIKTVLPERPLAVKIDPYDYVLGEDPKITFYVEQVDVMLPDVFIAQFSVVTVLLFASLVTILIYKKRKGEVI
ncbi:MAG: M1 family metallopeptidase [Thermoproteales archaeon]|nr:M1 family metallopeptidase [Thermoproteales archaeon]